MLRTNPPPLIHRNVLDSNIFPRSESDMTELVQEEIPLNLTCRRTSSQYSCEGLQEIPAQNETQSERNIPIQLQPWYIPQQHFLISANVNPLGVCYPRTYKESFRQEAMSTIVTKNSDFNVGVGWNLQYFQPYWQIIDAMAKMRMQQSWRIASEISEPNLHGNYENTSVQENERLSETTRDEIREGNVEGSFPQNCEPSKETKFSIFEEGKNAPTNTDESKSNVVVMNNIGSSHREDRQNVVEKMPNQARTKKSRNSISSFKCVQCGASYPHRFELNRHVKVSHIRPHRCEHCGKGFGHKNYLRVHIETVHMGRKSHKCQQCGKFLSTGGNLSVHVRTIHMGEKKYRCPICARTFGQQCNMKTHMRRHYLGAGTSFIPNVD